MFERVSKKIDRACALIDQFEQQHRTFAVLLAEGIALAESRTDAREWAVRARAAFATLGLGTTTH